MANHEHIADLIIKHLQSVETEAERTELQEWMGLSESHRQTVEGFLLEHRLAEGILDHWVEDRIWGRLDRLIGEEETGEREREETETEAEEIGLEEGKEEEREREKVEKEEMEIEEVEAGEEEAGRKERGTETEKAKVIPFYRRRLWRGVDAAVIVLALVGGYLLFGRKERSAPLPPSLAVQDVAAPLQARATIQLGDGRRIAVDSAGNGELASQGAVHVVKLADGQLAYTGKGGEVFYNTLTNPRGSRVISLVLADGTKVWLNAESSLRYPTMFAGANRTVEISGEGYFEVAQNARMPFVVKNGKTEVTVLGTQFNINSYADEAVLAVTLVDGAVKVSQEGNAALLKPGEQARVGMEEGGGEKREAQEKAGEAQEMQGGGRRDEHAGGKQGGKERGNQGMTAVQVVKNADLESVLAWKNGKFIFDGSGIEEIMRQVGRWYDVEISYQGKPGAQHFRGGIGRGSDVSKVLSMLEATDAIHFRIEGKKIIVLP